MMRVVETVAALRVEVGRLRGDGGSSALVPTMGNLHAGHLRLVEAARSHGHRVVVSIFVNPAQFGEGEDYDSYPRTLVEDSRQLEKAGVDVLFVPPVEEVYPCGSRTVVEVHELSDRLCGAVRPGHFSGVATVVCKLFNMVQPDAAFFGEKDFQQLAVIRRMAEDLNFPVKVHGVATVREGDGLAMSSRNGYLSPEERAVAPELYRALCTARAEILRGDRDYETVEARQLRRLKKYGFRPDYFTVRRHDDLMPPGAEDGELVILAAAWLGKARLIDNLRLTLSSPSDQ